MRQEFLNESREGVARGRVNRRQLAIGSASLLMGVGYYLALRPAGSVWFLPAALHVEARIPHAVGHLTGAFPTFSHTLAFSLLSAGVVAAGRRFGAVICAAWLAIEMAFEFGQHAAISTTLIAHLPLWIDRVWLLGNAPRYFARGTFDVTDIAASAVGAVIALLIICRTPPPETRL